MTQTPAAPQQRTLASYTTPREAHGKARPARIDGAMRVRDRDAVHRYEMETAPSNGHIATNSCRLTHNG
jgi:hypothetical protein